LPEVDEAALNTLLTDVAEEHVPVASDLEDAAVFVFTKSSLTRLKRTLPLVASSGPRVIVLDDSPDSDTQKWVRANFPAVTYHGKAEQSRLVTDTCLVGLEGLLSPLGQSRWQLGYCRNYAVVLARFFGLSRILMLDDDILVEEADFVLRMLTLLRQFDIVGSRTLGMPDDSVVGHLRRAIGWESCSFVSGQCLALHIPSIAYSFPNIYNEDWILSLLQSVDGLIGRYSGVTQLDYDPFAGIAEKALFQEFGEIVCEGVARAAVQKDTSLLLSRGFWRYNCMVRRDALAELSSALESGLGSRVWQVPVRALIGLHERLDAKEVQAYFRDYCSRLAAWNHTLSKIPVGRCRSILEGEQ
jgi:hypothetical protein